MDHLNLHTKYDETISFVQSIFNEYMTGDDPVFDEDTIIHVGTDEYDAKYKEEFRKYTDDMLKFVQDSNRTVRLWGSLSMRPGSTPVRSEGVQMNVWNVGWANPNAMIQAGYDIINTDDTMLYIVPGVTRPGLVGPYYHDYLDTQWLYNNWNPTKFGSNVTVSADSQQLLGATFAVWNDKSGVHSNGITEQDIYDRFADALPALASKMWGKGKNLTYQELVAAVDEIGVAPNNNPTFQASSVDGQYLSYTFEPGQEAQDVTANGRDLTNLHNVETQYDTLKLLGDESYVETPLAKLGFGNTLEFDVTLTQEAQPGQILFEADSEYDTHDIRILDDGTLGYTTELYDYSFGYTLPVGETVHLKVVSERENSALYVNGVRYDAVGHYSEEETGLNLTNIGYPSFVLPLQRIGSKTNAVVGLIDNVTVTVTPEVESFSASSEYSGNPIANAFGGLYRDVYVTVTGPVYITDAIESETTAGGGVFLTSPSVSKESATVNAKTEVENTGSSDASVTMVTEIVDGDSVVASQEDTKTVGAGEKYSFSQDLTVSNPRLWSVDTPELYTERSILKQDGAVIDTVETTYGIRKVEWKRDSCYINNERVELVGTNLHSETYMLGNAQSNDSIFEDVKRLKEYSFNFIRMSHYPHNPAFYEACDRYGVAVLDCLAGWQNYSDSEAFKNNTYEQMRDQMRVNRNHCSVVAWEPSLNESSFTTAWAQNMHNLVKEEYPEVGDSKAYTSGWINWNVFDIGVGTPQANVVGDASKYSDKPVIVSEYGDWNFGSFDSTTRVTREPKHYSDAEGGDKGMLTQCDNIQSSFAFNRGQSWYGATAYWDYADYTGFDVDKLTFCGVVDVARIAKHGAYFFQSQTDPNLDMSKYGLDTGAMVYIANTWASDSPDQVRVYSNCDEVELYLDDQLIARQTPDTQMWAPHGDTDNPTGYPTADSGAYVSTENLAHPPLHLRSQRLHPRPGHPESGGLPQR